MPCHFFYLFGKYFCFSKTTVYGLYVFRKNRDDVHTIINHVLYDFFYFFMGTKGTGYCKTYLTAFFRLHMLLLSALLCDIFMQNFCRCLWCIFSRKPRTEFCPDTVALTVIMIHAAPAGCDIYDRHSCRKFF